MGSAPGGYALDTLRAVPALVPLLVVVVVAVACGCGGHRLHVRATPADVRVYLDGALLCEGTPCAIDDARSLLHDDVRLTLERGGERRELVVAADRFDAAGCAWRAGSTACGGALMGGLCVGVGLAAGPLGFVAGPMGVPVPGLCGIAGGGLVCCAASIGAAGAPLASRIGPDEIVVDWAAGTATASPPARVELTAVAPASLAPPALVAPPEPRSSLAPPRAPR